MGAIEVQTKPEVLATGWDGVGVGRPFFLEWRDRLHGDSTIQEPLSDIPHMDHTPKDYPLRGLGERASYFFHGKRKKTGLVDRLITESGKGKPVHIISSRPATKKWEGLSRKQANEAGLKPTSITHTPLEFKNGKLKKVDGADSKIDGIKAVGATTYFEDHLPTAKKIAAALPEVVVKWIDNGVKVDRKFLEQHPNFKAVSAAELFKQRENKKASSGVSETRNSPIREKVSFLVNGITKFIHKQFPGLSPTHINFLGAGLVGLGACLAAMGRKLEAGILISLGSIADAFDGALARLMNAEKPGSVNFKRGALYDVLSDRFQELFLAWSRMVSAHKGGGFMGTIGELAALAAAITNPLASVARAFSESRGKAVHESGIGIIGLAGTRPGRGVTGGGTVVEPGPNGIFQIAVDAFTSYSNVKTFKDRLQTAFSKGEGTLSKETREDAKTRLKVLLAFTAVSLAGSLFTYRRLHRNESKPPVEKELSPNEYLGVISTIDEYLTKQDITHWFVGGTLTDFLGPKTEFAIDVENKKITLINPNEATSERKDGTTKDIDIVVNTSDKDKLDKVRMAIDQWSKQAKAKGIRFPQISMEAARYPDWPKRNNLTQFVTAWEIDQQNTPHLVFGAVDQALKPESIEPWTIDLVNGATITVFNPIAHALCYRLRVPSGEKKKDTAETGTYDNWIIRLPYSKMSLVDGMARKVIAAGLEKGVDFNDMFKEWGDYIKTLSKKPDLLTRIKGIFTGLYWNSIGAQVAHGKGAFGFLSNLNDRMTG